MAEFNIRADSVDVTQIMERVRASIREGRSPDDAERQIREQTEAAIDRCLAPLRAGSDRVEHDRRLALPGRFDRDRQGNSLAPEPFEFNEDTVYVSSAGGTMGKLIRLIRKLLNPILRLFFNPDPIIFAMMRQAEINSRLLDLLNRVNGEFERTGRKFAAREDLDALNYEVTQNLVAEMTRLAVDMKNHKMLVESVAARLDFDERRAQALGAARENRSTPETTGPEPAADGDGAGAAPTRTRRRRRRSRRRPGAAAPNAAADAGEATPPGDAADGGGPAEGTSEPAANAADGAASAADVPSPPAEAEPPPAAAVPTEAPEPPAPSSSDQAAPAPTDGAGDR